MLLLRIMGAYLVFAFNIREIFSVIDNNTIDGLKSIFEGIGFSASCVSKALSTCEQKSAANSAFVDYKSLNSNLETKPKHQMLEEIYPKNCAEIQKMGDNETGIRKIYPYRCCSKNLVYVYCDQKTDGGGWTVIHHRKVAPKREKFYRKWLEYKLGFGNLSGEFWLGLDNIHALVSTSLMELRVDLEDFEGHARFAKYEHFYISDESEKYKMNLGDYSGNAGDGLGPLSGMKFTTQDQDNDESGKNCAKTYKGAWWYKACHSSNLNGLPHEGNHTSFADGINWKPFRGHNYSLKIAKLSMRPKFAHDY